MYWVEIELGFCVVSGIKYVVKELVIILVVICVELFDFDVVLICIKFFG